MVCLNINLKFRKHSFLNNYMIKFCPQNFKLIEISKYMFTSDKAKMINHTVS